MALSKESSDLSRQIHTLNNYSSKSKSEIKVEVKTILENKGFEIKTKTQHGSEVLILSKSEAIFTVLLKQSKFHDTATYVNAKLESTVIA